MLLNNPQGALCALQPGRCGGGGSFKGASLPAADSASPPPPWEGGLPDPFAPTLPGLSLLAYDLPAAINCLSALANDTPGRDLKDYFFAGSGDPTLTTRMTVQEAVTYPIPRMRWSLIDKDANAYCRAAHPFDPCWIWTGDWTRSGATCVPECGKLEDCAPPEPCACYEDQTNLVFTNKCKSIAQRSWGLSAEEASTFSYVPGTIECWWDPESAECDCSMVCYDSDTNVRWDAPWVGGWGC